MVMYPTTSRTFDSPAIEPFGVAWCGAVAVNSSHLRASGHLPLTTPLLTNFTHFSTPQTPPSLSMLGRRVAVSCHLSRDIGKVERSIREGWMVPTRCCFSTCSPPSNSHNRDRCGRHFVSQKNFDRSPSRCKKMKASKVAPGPSPKHPKTRP